MNFKESNTISTEISVYAQQLPMAEQKAILNVLKSRAILERAKKVDASSKENQDKLTTEEIVKICRAVRKTRMSKIAK